MGYKCIIIADKMEDPFGLTVKPYLWLGSLAQEVPTLFKTSYRCSVYINVLGTFKA